MRMQRAWLRLQGNPDRVLRIQDLARGSNFSLWYFTKVFSAVYGIGPQQFGVQVRLEQARDLLCQPALSINEVAAACGFENACSFARTFRSHYHVTATVYRQQLPLAAAVA
jgi:AraC family transcriptional regulator